MPLPRTPPRPPQLFDRFRGREGPSCHVMACCFQRLPECCLNEIVSFLQCPEWLEEMLAVSGQMVARMLNEDTYNHMSMIRGRVVLSFVGCCRWLHNQSIGKRTLMFQRKLHETFIRFCIKKLQEVVKRWPAYELRALKLTASRMPPALARRHVMEQCRLRAAAVERYRSDRDVVQKAGLERITGKPALGMEDQKELRSLEGMSAIMMRWDREGS